MKKLVTYSEKIIRYMTVLGAVAMVFMCLLVVINIISRKLFSFAVPGAVEMTQQALVCIVWFGAGTCVLENSMLDVDIFKFPRRYLQIIKLITAVICLITGWASFVGGNNIRVSGARTSQLDIPKFIFQWVVALGFLLVTVAIIIVFIKECRHDNKSSGTIGGTSGTD